MLVALAIVGAALLIARHGHGGHGFGVVAQVAPPVARDAGLPTAPRAGALAPNFRLQTTDGRTLRLSDLRGRPVVLNFWATWCDYCVTEMPALQHVAGTYGNRIAVVGVNVGETDAKARAFAGPKGIHYPLVLDPELDVAGAYQVRAMPTSLIIDADGVVRVVHYGVLTPAELEAALAPLLGH